MGCGIHPAQHLQGSCSKALRQSGISAVWAWPGGGTSIALALTEAQALLPLDASIHVCVTSSLPRSAETHQDTAAAWQKRLRLAQSCLYAHPGHVLPLPAGHSDILTRLQQDRCLPPLATHPCQRMQTAHQDRVSAACSSPIPQQGFSCLCLSGVSLQTQATYQERVPAACRSLGRPCRVTDAPAAALGGPAARRACAEPQDAPARAAPAPPAADRGAGACWLAPGLACTECECP